MAVKRQVIETRTSDLSGEESEGVRTIKATIDGKAFRLDLTPAEVASLEGMLAPYFEAFETVKSGNGNAATEDDGPQIRQWGRDHGYDVSDRGKLSASLKAAYYSAQSDPANTVESVKPAAKVKAGK